jgi:hypothetical protein
MTPATAAALFAAIIATAAATVLALRHHYTVIHRPRTEHDADAAAGREG